MIRPYVFKGFLAGPTSFPLGFCEISLKLAHGEGLKCVKLFGWHFFLDFARWILGDTSLRFRRCFGGPDILPFRILPKNKKMATFKNVVQKKMLDGEGYVFRSGGVLSTMLLTHQVRRDTTISNMSS